MTTKAIGAILAATALALGGCGGTPADPPPPQALETAPENPPGLTLTEATVRLPAVAGRPGVAYFTVSQATGPSRAISAVEVEGAGRAEMHETTENEGTSSMTPIARVAIAAGKSVEFAPGGRHVMLFDLDPSLRAGGETDVAVRFEDGDSVTARARITAAGGA